MTSSDGSTAGPSIEQANRTYLRIGRVVSHAALMEQWLFYLATALDRTQTQQEIAGTFGRGLVVHCRGHLDTVAEPLKKDDLAQLLDDIELVQDRRNVVVHSVLAQPGDPTAYAHRPLPKRQRKTENEWIGSANLTDDHLEDLDREIHRILARLFRIMPDLS